ncbi:WAT1-related protein [Arachis hypogaea]|uniref:WAT1-related protein n=2 Tax=Arachis TaxID=3817 RepID=A0A6B9VCA6_ARAHY|nr:WAT1-related protein [Arachis hypogaea]
MTTPVCTILAAILAYFVFGEKLGASLRYNDYPRLYHSCCNFSILCLCIIGATFVIIGLYLLLWGKEGDQKIHVNTKPCNGEDSKYILQSTISTLDLKGRNANPSRGKVKRISH